MLIISLPHPPNQPPLKKTSPIVAPLAPQRPNYDASLCLGGKNIKAHLTATAAAAAIYTLTHAVVVGNTSLGFWFGDFDEEIYGTVPSEAYADFHLSLSRRRWPSKLLDCGGEVKSGHFMHACLYRNTRAENDCPLSYANQRESANNMLQHHCCCPGPAGQMQVGSFILRSPSIPADRSK